MHNECSLCRLLLQYLVLSACAHLCNSTGVGLFRMCFPCTCTCGVQYLLSSMQPVCPQAARCLCTILTQAISTIHGGTRRVCGLHRVSCWRCGLLPAVFWSPKKWILFADTKEYEQCRRQAHPEYGAWLYSITQAHCIPLVRCAPSGSCTDIARMLQALLY